MPNGCHPASHLMAYLEDHVGKNKDALLVPAPNRALSAAWSNARSTCNERI